MAVIPSGVGPPWSVVPLRCVGAACGRKEVRSIQTQLPPAWPVLIPVATIPALVSCTILAFVSL